MTARTMVVAAAVVSLTFASGTPAVMCSFESFAPDHPNPETWVSAPNSFAEVHWRSDGSLVFGHAACSVCERCPSAIALWFSVHRRIDRAVRVDSGITNSFIVDLTANQPIVGEFHPLSVLLQTGPLAAGPVGGTAPWYDDSIASAPAEMDDVLPASEPTTIAVLMLAGFVFFIPRR